MAANPRAGRNVRVTDLWTAASIPPDTLHEARVGPLGIRLKYSGDEIHAAFEHGVETDPPGELFALRPAGGEASAGGEWRRWVVGGEVKEVRLLPVMPDRAVVVRPETHVEILEGREAVFYVSIPVWVRVQIVSPGESTVCEEPILILSNTWFGEPVAGELCYSLQTRARRSFDGSETRPHRAVCPVRVTNVSNGPLNFERLCIRAQHLKVFGGKGGLWTNAVRVRYRGEEHGSQVDYDPGPPDKGLASDLLAEEREPMTRSVFRRSFTSLRSMTGI
jgi:hypothetical protein